MAVKKVVESSIAIQHYAAEPFIAKPFGFGRVTEEMKEEIFGGIDESVKKWMVIKDAEFLKVKN